MEYQSAFIHLPFWNSALHNEIIIIRRLKINGQREKWKQQQQPNEIRVQMFE